jgi:GDP-L-fucose synthase
MSIGSTRIFLAGHKGMVGSALLRLLSTTPANEIITADRQELNLLNQEAVNSFFAVHRFDQVYLAAAKVGGIHANNVYPADFIYENLVIQTNVIQAAHSADVQKLLFLGSSCIYPRHAEQPMAESALLTGPLEMTNEPYAIAKIAGIKLCESFNRQHGRDYRCVMPTNLYGPGDNFHPLNSHVIPALMRRFHEAKILNSKEVVIWGSGNAMREFLYVDDMASASVHVMNIDPGVWHAHVQPTVSHINVGTGADCTIRNLAETLARVTDYTGRLVFDTSMPDGTPRKLLNVQCIRDVGWRSNTELEHGLAKTYEWFVANRLDLRS